MIINKWNQNPVEEVQFFTIQYLYESFHSSITCTLSLTINFFQILNTFSHLCINFKNRKNLIQILIKWKTIANWVLNMNFYYCSNWYKFLIIFWFQILQNKICRTDTKQKTQNYPFEHIFFTIISSKIIPKHIAYMTIPDNSFNVYK